MFATLQYGDEPKRRVKAFSAFFTTGKSTQYAMTSSYVEPTLAKYRSSALSVVGIAAA